MKSFCFWTFNWNILIRIVETRMWTIPEIKVLTDEKEDPPSPPLNTFPEYISLTVLFPNIFHLCNISQNLKIVLQL